MKSRYVGLYLRLVYRIVSCKGCIYRAAVDAEINRASDWKVRLGVGALVITVVELCINVLSL